MEAALGIHVSAAGYTRVARNSPYPPRRHPASHEFEGKRGRTLAAFQLVLISKGAGIWENQFMPVRPIGAGDCFFLFPGVRHRYQPSRSRGWTEHWFELRGATCALWLQSLGIGPDRPVLSLADADPILTDFRRLHDLCHHKPQGYRAALTAYALAILGEVNAQTSSSHKDREQTDALAREAVRKMSSGMVQIQDLARELGVSYATLHRRFRIATGLSPKHYLEQIRIARAEELLATSRLSIKEIASSLGYYSAFHFSQQFKQHRRVSPTVWRRQQDGEASLPEKRSSRRRNSASLLA